MAEDPSGRSGAGHRLQEIGGLMVAEQLKQQYPDAAVIFLTAFPWYAVQAFKPRATAYLLKPVSLEDLKEEVDYANSRRPERPSEHIVVQTFGSFEIFVDGETLVFHRGKARKLRSTGMAGRESSGYLRGAVGGGPV